MHITYLLPKPVILQETIAGQLGHTLKLSRLAAPPATQTVASLLLSTDGDSMDKTSMFKLMELHAQSLHNRTTRLLVLLVKHLLTRTLFFQNLANLDF